jgi:hypothetical protein
MSNQNWYGEIELLSDYFKLGGAGEPTDALPKLLRSLGLEFESFLLLKSWTGARNVLFENDWTDKPIALGSRPPENPQVGDCWFDPIELMLTVFVPNSEGRAKGAGGWFPSHPVQIWQYLGFIEALDFDYLSRPRYELFTRNGLNLENPLAFATNIFANEAYCYARWFGKALIGERISCAKVALPTWQVNKIAPQEMLLWDEDGAEGREDLPLAFHLETCEFEDLSEQTEKEFPPNRRIVYDEWERNPSIGFSCYAKATGLHRFESGILSVYVHSSNSPTR